VSIIIYCLFKGHTHPRRIRKTANEERNIVLRLRVFDIPGNFVIKQSSFQTIRIKPSTLVGNGGFNQRSGLHP